MGWKGEMEDSLERGKREKKKEKGIGVHKKLLKRTGDRQSQIQKELDTKRACDREKKRVTSKQSQGQRNLETERA